VAFRIPRRAGLAAANISGNAAVETVKYKYKEALHSFAKLPPDNKIICPGGRWNRTTRSLLAIPSPRDLKVKPGYH
jgi:hypothetical protein